ncbi:hypothetical protein ABZ698_21510 [Streptomyces antibioticus]
MAHSPGAHGTFEELRERAVTLRRTGSSRRQIRDELRVHNNDIPNRLLEGEPPPDRTRRPNAKDDLRDRARELRLQGRTYDRIQTELGCSKSSISLWVRDLPRPERKPHNTGDGYHGCLRVAVLQSADLHRRVEGRWYGIVGAALPPGLKKPDMGRDPSRVV